MPFQQSSPAPFSLRSGESYPAIPRHTKARHTEALPSRHEDESTLSSPACPRQMHPRTAEVLDKVKALN